MSASRRRPTRFSEPPIQARRAARLAASLALRGAILSASEFHDPRKPYCDEPVLIRSRRDPRHGDRAIEASQWGPCRRCEKCLLFRQYKISERILRELYAADARRCRSWWITLTVDEIHLAGIKVAASKTKYWPHEPKRAEDAAFYVHVQKYLKRLRAAAPLSRFRYLSVTEWGEDTGRIHGHMILHEIGPRPLTKRLIEAHWRSHTRVRLVDVGARVSGLGTYIAKYATKELGVAYRASLRYGAVAGGPLRDAAVAASWAEVQRAE